MDAHTRTLMKINWTFIVILCSTFLFFPGEGVAQLGGIRGTTGSWNFDESCAGYRNTTVELTKPAAMLMVDRSGSMASLRSTGYQCWEECTKKVCRKRFLGICTKRECVETKQVCGNVSVTLWEAAVTAIDRVVQELDDEIEFGIGFFPQGSRNGAYIKHEASIPSYSKISSALAGESPTGGNTPTHDAAEVLSQSQTMKRTNQAVRGVLITDGYPVGVSETTVINNICDARRSGQIISVVGLGGATDTQFNNKMAAAGGTGSCSTDPCDDPSVNKSSCTGSISAANTTEFENALRAIMGELSCRFPVDTSAFEPGQSPSDPGALRVRLSGTIVPYRSSPSGEGWFYPDPNNRTEIELSDQYCSDIEEGLADRVETTLACPCTKTAGEDCPVENAPYGVCPVGEWACSRGYDECIPKEPQHCPVPCPGWDWSEDEEVLCHVDIKPEDSTPAIQSQALALERNRCKIGVAKCVNRTPSCDQKYRAMPEICNGLDNDCDGTVGNIRESWEKDWSSVVGAGYTPEAAACYGEDLCRCRGSIGEHAGEGSTPEAEFQSYLQAHSPGNDEAGCICVEN